MDLVKPKKITSVHLVSVSAPFSYAYTSDFSLIEHSSRCVSGDAPGKVVIVDKAIREIIPSSE